MALSARSMARHPAHEPNKEGQRITGRGNRWLKRFREALAGERDDGGFVGIEGVRMVEAALGAGLPVEALLASDSGCRHLPRLTRVLKQGIPIFRTSDKIFEGVADTQAPQGIAALVQPRKATVESMATGTALIVVLVGLQDPGNVGTIIRAAEAFGATGAVTCPVDRLGTADPFGPKALRASAGSALRLPIVHGLSSTVLLTQLRILGTKVYAAVATEKEEGSAGRTPASSRLCPWDINWKAPAAILIGNEGAGLPAGLVRTADAQVYIPQAAAATRIGIESLNAAMAASVLLYEAARQRALALRD